MSKVVYQTYKYAAVQFQSKIYEPQESYLVISTKWISRKKEIDFFYWPNKDLLNNKMAVKHCVESDSSWIVVRIKKIIGFSSKYYC